MLKEKYGKDLRIVYKPFVVHMSTAMAGALAACAANKQHKFAEVDATLWEGYKAGKLDKDTGGAHCWQSKEGCPVALAAARDAKLDVGKFTADLLEREDVGKALMADMMSFTVAAILDVLHQRPRPHVARRQPQASAEGGLSTRSSAR